MKKFTRPNFVTSIVHRVRTSCAAAINQLIAIYFITNPVNLSVASLQNQFFTPTSVTKYFGDESYKHCVIF